MTLIYIDESGDLGMSPKGSNYFIITAVKLCDSLDVGYCRIPKKIRQKGLKKKDKKTSELKFSNSSVLIREMFLNRVAKLDISIYSLIIEKKYTQHKLKENLPILYNYLTKILLEKVLVDIKREKLTLCLDKCMSQPQRDNFENYIKTEFFNLFQDVPEVEIIHENSCSHPGLIVTDFICGAFGYKYNTAKLKGDFNRYVDLIQNKIKIEKTNLFKKQ